MKSEKSSKIDSRFVYGEPPKWKQGHKQFLWGTEHSNILPTTKTPTLYEFELPVGSILLFGSQSGFYVRGRFESKTSTAADSTYALMSDADVAEVALVPNWFEHLLKDIQLYHGNMPLNPHDVPRYSDAFLNAYLYAHMYSETKKCLMPEPQAPGYCVGLKSTDFSLTDTDCSNHKYLKEVFGEKKVEFRWVPLHTFPFMQQPNFCTDGRPPAAIPFPVLQKISIQLPFKENQDLIFLKKAGSTKSFRFKIESIELMVEEARINPSMERAYLSQKGPLYFSGLTKFAMTENINRGVNQHRLRFQDVPMPEGIFVCALPKSALSGNYQNSTVSAEVFVDHNIQTFDVHFNNMPLAIKSPNFGDLRLPCMEIKQLMDHYDQPPFGVLQEPTLITMNAISEGGKQSAYPHIYIPLCPSGKETRIVPIGGDGQTINKNGDLDISLKFGTDGAKDATYLVYIFYTDVNMVLDMNNQVFSPVYKRAKAN